MRRVSDEARGWLRIWFTSPVVLSVAPALVVGTDTVLVQAQRCRIVPKNDIVEDVEVPEVLAVIAQGEEQVGKIFPLAAEGASTPERRADVQSYEVGQPFEQAVQNAVLLQCRIPNLVTQMQAMDPCAMSAREIFELRQVEPQGLQDRVRDRQLCQVARGQSIRHHTQPLGHFALVPSRHT